MNRNYFHSGHFTGFILVCCFLIAFTFSDPLEKIISGFSRYLELQPQEKIYLHFDRPYYTAGDSIRFRVYLLAGPYHEPSAISNIVYVDLLDKKNRIIRHTNLLSLNGMASGSIPIPDSIASGQCTIRAYTSWMRNSGDDYLFQHVFKVWGNDPDPVTANQENLDLQFFPEGGELVAGLPSRVAFKAVSGDGLSSVVTGKIYDGTMPVAEFKSNGLGMGIFYLTPQTGKTYTARIDNNPDMTFSLPSIKQKGLTMTVNLSSKAKDITVAVRSNNESIKSLYLLAHVRGHVCFSASISMSTNVAIARIPKSNFPTGIAQIVVLSADGAPLAERLIFTDQQDDLTVKVTSTKSVYEPRESITLDIQTNNNAGVPVPATLSLSAVDAKQIRSSYNAESIKTYLLLSSELKGHIESPGYYFNTDNTDREQALDYLMLTQGWRKFTIKQALADASPVQKFPAEKGLTIKGILVDAYNSKPIADGKITFFGFDPLPQTKTVTTDKAGAFEIHDVLYFNASNAVLRGETKKGSKAVRIILTDSIPHLSLSVPSITDKDDVASEKIFLEQSKERHQIDALYNVNDKTITLKEIEIEGKKDDPESSVRRPYGKGTKSIKVADNLTLENQLHPLQLVQGRFPGVQVVGIGDAWKVQMQGAGSILSGTTPLIMIDDIPVSIETLNTLPVNQVESVTVWRGPDAAIFGSRGANGAIGFYTKKTFAHEQQSSNESGIVRLKNGLEMERVFYTPRYDIASPLHSKPDRRVTLFWAPYIQTDSMGHAQVTFFNDDIETKVTGTIEGISAAGEPAYGSFTYEIRKSH